MELFMYGDPRLLAGCDGVIDDSRRSYENAPPTVDSTGWTTEKLERYRTSPGEEPKLLASRAGISIHQGKAGYHGTPVYNRFLADGQWPSAGIELETVAARSCDHAWENSLVEDLWSNWFHFERDGSLPENGYELVTEPLPPRVYRDPRTWIGLENVISPWLESFDHRETGLHVHVGLNQFMDFDTIPLENRISRTYVGKMMSMLTYYVLAGSALVDRVTLRKNTTYCATSPNRDVFAGTEDLESGKLTGAQFVDLAVSKLNAASTGNFGDQVRAAAEAIAPRSGIPFCQVNASNTTCHGTEVNCEHRFTIEFRRGKGTCHSLSIHRMVELMTGIVRYAGKCAREPDFEVSRESFLDFISRTTTSAVLRNMIDKKGK